MLATEVSSFLITTPKGHILLDSGFAETVPLIQANLKKLGFKMEDVKRYCLTATHTSIMLEGWPTSKRIDRG